MAADDRVARPFESEGLGSIVGAKVSTTTNINQHSDERKGSHERTGRFQSDRGNVSKGVQANRGQIRSRAGCGVDFFETVRGTVLQPRNPRGVAGSRRRNRSERRAAAV